ncbi:hypothetical protein DV451_004489 [Geotrichum candidum]|uniref:Eukaryotic translation initiation factor 3 subunit M n=1 Tax=Geotrichum candidum TaxID=1173061 RepID=A0A9P5KSK3_GEOCN|nr:hypothetical protein DV451_004489 [Geotrichum candidum]
MAYVQNYMVVDGVLKDLVEDIAAYIDKLSPEASFSSFIQERLVDSDESAFNNPEEIFKAIAERSAVLSQAPERDFEPQYNLVLHILTFSSNLTAILPIVLKNLSTPPSYPNGPILSLAVLSNLFNILPVSSPLRYQVFLAILDTAAATNNFGLIIAQLNSLPTWLQEWNVDEQAIRDIYVKISDTLTASKDSQIAYQHLLSAVSSQSSSTAPNPLASKLVQIALASESIFDFDDLFALESVQALKSSATDLYSLLENVATGNYKPLSSVDEKFLTVNKFDRAQLERKARILALSKAASQSTQRTIPYTVFASAIEVSIDEIEVWIIDAIRAGLIEGRLSQMSQSFSVHRATPVGTFGAEEWKFVDNKLASWRSGLKDILAVLKTARENAERGEEKMKKQQQQQQQQQQQPIVAK